MYIRAVTVQIKCLINRTNCLILSMGEKIQRDRFIIMKTAFIGLDYSSVWKG
jgi:hypothetical protein